jgi:hypothetical protein
MYVSEARRIRDDGIRNEWLLLLVSNIEARLMVASIHPIAWFDTCSPASLQNCIHIFSLLFHITAA